MYFGATISKISTFKNNVYPQYLTNSQVQNLLTILFSAITQYLLCVLKYISQTVTQFLLLSTENKKKTVISDILKTITMGVNMITRQMTPFFSYTP